MTAALPFCPTAGHREFLEREAARLRESGLRTPPTPGSGA